MRESRIEKTLRREVEKRDGKALKFISPGTRGVPDRLVLFPGGRAVFVELKAPGEKLEPLQEFRADEIRQLGFCVYCLDSTKAVKKFITEVFS